MSNPDWLNERFLSSVLREAEDGQNVKILDYTVKPIDASYFASDILEVTAVYKNENADVEKSIPLIIKLPIFKGFFNELSKKYKLFETEPLLYNELFPKMYKKIKTELAPRSYKCPKKDILVLKDLRPEGYTVTKRYVQYDFEHSKAIVEVLAKFHAGSVACHHEDPGLVELVGKEKVYITEGPCRDSLEPWTTKSFIQCAKTMLELGIDKEITDFILNKADDTLWDRISKLHEPNPNTLNVLNHGDLWTSNVLFKYGTNGEIADAKLIDFQRGVYGSPVLDIIYFTWSHVNEEVREHKLPELYRIYLKTLNRTLADLRCPERMSFEELQRDLKDYIDWTVVTICYVLTFLMCEQEDFIEEGSLTPEQFRSVEKDPRFSKYFTNKNVKPLLPGIARQLKAFISL